MLPKYWCVIIAILLLQGAVAIAVWPLHSPLSLIVLAFSAMFLVTAIFVED